MLTGLATLTVQQAAMIAVSCLCSTSPWRAASLSRVYRQSDSRSRSFGIGATHPYDIFLVGDLNPYTYQELILADGGKGTVQPHLGGHRLPGRRVRAHW